MQFYFKVFLPRDFWVKSSAELKATSTGGKVVKQRSPNGVQNPAADKATVMAFIASASAILSLWRIFLFWPAA